MRLISLLVVVLLLLQGCSAPQKRAVVVPDVPVVTNPDPVLTPAQEALYQQALAAMRRGESAKAERTFEALIKQEPRLAGVYVNLALIAQQRDEQARAAELVSRALEHNPRNVDALVLAASRAQSEGDFETSERLLLTAAKIAPQNSAVQYNLGVLYELYLQEYDRAKTHYERYLAVSDHEDTAMVQRWIKLLERKL